MRQEQYKISVEASPEDAFDFLTDQATLSQWLPGLISSEVVGGGAVQVGSKLRQVREQGGRKMTGEATVVAHVRGQMHAVEVNIMGVRTTFAFKFQPEEGQTSVALQATYEGSGLFKMPLEAMVASMCRSCNEETVRNLKAAIEQRQAVSP